MNTNFFMLSNGGHSDDSTMDEVEIRAGGTSPLQTVLRTMTSVRSPLSNIDWSNSSPTEGRWRYDPQTMYQDEMTRRFIDDRTIQEMLERNYRETNNSMTIPPLTQVSSNSGSTQGLKAYKPKYSPTEETVINFLKEKVELKFNGIKTDTTLEFTLSLNLIDTGESLISTQDIIELD